MSMYSFVCKANRKRGLKGISSILVTHYMSVFPYQTVNELGILTSDLRLKLCRHSRLLPSRIPYAIPVYIHPTTLAGKYTFLMCLHGNKTLVTSSPVTLYVTNSLLGGKHTLLPSMLYFQSFSPPYRHSTPIYF